MKKSTQTKTPATVADIASGNTDQGQANKTETSNTSPKPEEGLPVSFRRAMHIDNKRYISYDDGKTVYKPLCSDLRVNAYSHDKNYENCGREIEYSGIDDHQHKMNVPVKSLFDTKERDNLLLSMIAGGFSISSKQGAKDKFADLLANYKTAARTLCDPLTSWSTVGQTEKAIERVWEYFERNHASKFALWNPDDKSVEGKVIDGYKCVIEDEVGKHYKFYVLSDTFRDVICKGLNHPEVCKGLEKLRLIERDGENNFTHLVRLPGGRRKVYVISSTIEVADESEDAEQSKEKTEQEDETQAD